MRKHVFGRQFKRDANERKALFKNLLTSLVMEERIQTTPEKAKAIKAAADKLVTKAKKGGDVAFRSLAPEVHHKAVVKLISDLAPRFVNRQGGYTRIIKVGRRIADNAPQAIMEWTEKKVIVETKEAKGTKGKKEAKSKKETKKAEVKVKAEKAKKVTKKNENKKEGKKVEK